MERILSPLSGDYTNNVCVSPIQNAVYIRLMTPLGSYWANPGMGSKLHLLAREKDLTRIGLLAKQYAEQALQPLIEDGRAQSITIDATQPHNGRLELMISVVDSDNRRFDFKNYIRV